MGLLGSIFKKNELEIGSPAAGECVSIKEVPDPTFSEEIVGKGVAIKPSDGKFYAPADGTVNTLFPTFHAIGITTAEGAEVLIHIGIDTVQLKGEHFKAFVEQDASIKKGDLLIEADLEAIKEAGYDTITPVIICNMDKYKDVNGDTGKSVAAGDTIIRLRS